MNGAEPCPHCLTPLYRGSRAGQEFASCVSCGLSFVDGRDWEPVRSGGAQGIEPYPPTAGSSCCGQCEEGVWQRRSGLTGSRCRSCGRVTLPTDAMLTALRSGRQRAAGQAAPEETLFTGATHRPKRRRNASDEERNRVFAFLFLVPLELSEDVDPRPPVVLATLGGCALLFLAMVVEPSLAAWLALDIERLRWLTPLELVTSVVVHWDFLHLAGNMYFLYVFGRTVEQHAGAATTLAVLLASGVAGSLTFLFVHLGEPISLGGSSGAVAGVLGAYFLLFPARSVGLSLFFWVLRVPAFIFLGFWLLFQFFAVAEADGVVAYEAHIGGFVTGGLIAFVSRRRRRSAEPSRELGRRPVGL